MISDIDIESESNDNAMIAASVVAVNDTNILVNC
jgi:hypothetical protein